MFVLKAQFTQDGEDSRADIYVLANPLILLECCGNTIIGNNGLHFLVRAKQEEYGTQQSKKQTGSSPGARFATHRAGELLDDCVDGLPVLTEASRVWKRVSAQFTHKRLQT